MADVERIICIVAPVVRGLGLDIVNAAWGQQGRSRVLRIDIDRARSGPVPFPYAGSDVTAEELTGATREISAVLDVHDVETGRYVLEVSTPGLDRPLRGIGDFRDFTGHEIKVVLVEPLDGRKRLRGWILGVEELEGRQFVLLSGETDQEPQLRIDLPDIMTAKLVVGLGGFGSHNSGKLGRGKKRNKQ